MLKKAVPFLSLLLAFILLTACGQNAANEPASSPSPSASPAAAGRIASMSIHITNNLLALGLTPAGSVVGGDVKDFLPHVKDRLEGVQKLGVVTEPDMEAVLALKPDSIFIDETYSGPDLAKFEQIAPTVSINPDKGTWKDHLRELAGHVGRQQQAEDFILDYDKQKDEVGALIKSRLGADAKVMAVRMTAKELRVMGMKRPVGPLLYDDLGLQPADGVEKIDKAYEVISQEVLPDFDADAILVIVSKGSEAKKNYGLLESNPLWKSLKAVQNKHVYVLDGQKWLDYSSLGHKMALDDAAKLFAE
ncbi:MULTISPECIES: ABC transporter substrate-binding protein [Paenibacillus]|uniref:ABC transporter substrate-binding protein n=1 Tax=Paenibacillus TaxID=44249 RepID=UPI0003FA4484|nr:MULTISPECIES: ABC transporter substrate-binding protein [Paenibacillus]